MQLEAPFPHPSPLPRGEGAASAESDWMNRLVSAIAARSTKEKRGRHCVLRLPASGFALNQTLSFLKQQSKKNP